MTLQFPATCAGSWRPRDTDGGCKNQLAGISESLKSESLEKVTEITDFVRKTIDSFFFKIYFYFRERERENKQESQRERERENLNRLPAECRAQHRAPTHDPEIVT